MKIDEIWNYGPKANIWMLMLVFFNITAFDHMYWMVKDPTRFGEVVGVECIAYAAVYVITLIAFTMEFKRLNTKIEVSAQ